MLNPKLPSDLRLHTKCIKFAHALTICLENIKQQPLSSFKWKLLANVNIKDLEVLLT